MNAAVWISSIGTIVGYCLIIDGWFFVRSDSNRREKRKELRSQLDIAAKEVDSIAANAKKLLTNSGRGSTAILSREVILAELKVLGVRTQVVSYTYPGFSVAK